MDVDYDEDYRENAVAAGPSKVSLTQQSLRQPSPATNNWNLMIARI